VSETYPSTFRRAVVALAGGPGDERIVRLVSELARPARGEVVAVHVVEIGWSLPLDADIAGRSEEIQRILDAAETVAEGTKMRLEAVLLQARDVGAALVDETTERGADLLVLSETGYGKRVPLTEFRLKHRGGQGVRLIALEGRKTGAVAAVQQVTDMDEELVLISAHGQVVRTELSTINRYSPSARGVIVMRLNEDDRVVGIAAFRPGLAEGRDSGDNDDPGAAGAGDRGGTSPDRGV